MTKDKTQLICLSTSAFFIMEQIEDQSSRNIKYRMYFIFRFYDSII